MGLPTERDRLRRLGAIRQARYRATPRGMAVQLRYNTSQRRRDSYLRYRATERGHLLRKLRDLRPDVLLQKRLYMQERN